MVLEPPRPSLPDHTPAIDALLERHGLRREGPPVHLADSIQNPSYRVATGGGAFVVRVHKKSRTVDGIAFEHAVMRYAAAGGVPVALPVPTASGETAIRAGGVLLALYPWVEGRTATRGSITPGEAALLGETEGRIHAALAGYPGEVPRAWRSGAQWDTETSIAQLSRVDDLIRYYPAPGDEYLRAQEGLRDALDLLETPGVAVPWSSFSGLRLTLVHGDFHERNVILGGDGAVAAVVDWEAAGLLPPLFELLRCVTFAGLLDEPHLGAYLDGYHRHATIDAGACEASVEFWWQSLLHDTWVYTRRFIEGDHGVTRFFPETRANIARLREPAERGRLAAALRAHAG